MSFEEIKAICASIGLILFMAVFIGIVAWVFLRPNAKSDSAYNANIPLREDD